MAVRLPSSYSAKPGAADHKGFAAAMAASQVSAAPTVNYESRISRAALVAAETPVVTLLEREACLDCPHFARRRGADLSQPDPTIFNSMIVTAGEDVDLLAAAAAPPKILAGIDLGLGPHEPVTPGFEDFARIIDPDVLTDALYYNGILPECACTRALFKAADSDLFNGLKLDLLHQSAATRRRKASPPLLQLPGPGRVGALAPPS